MFRYAEGRAQSAWEHMPGPEGRAQNAWEHMPGLRQKDHIYMLIIYHSCIVCILCMLCLLPAGTKVVWLKWGNVNIGNML